MVSPKKAILITAVALVFSCGRKFDLSTFGSDGDGYTVGGSLSGLQSGSVVLQLSSTSSESLTLSSTGSFTFKTRLASGSNFSVSVTSSPANHACSVTPGNGTISDNYTGLNVSCAYSAGTLSLGGTITGLTAGTLVLSNNGELKSIAASGAYTFSLLYNTGNNYFVSVNTHPAGYTCSIAGGSGTFASGNITGVNVTCTAIPPGQYTVGGTVNGLAGTGLVMSLGASTVNVGANGSYLFGASFAAGAFALSASAQPTNPWQTCTPVSGTVNVVSSNVSNADVSCVTNTYTVGLTLTGVSNSDVITIQNNSNNVFSHNGIGTITTTNTFNVLSNQSYFVTVSQQPTGKTCTVTNPTGTVTNANITGASAVTVNCTLNKYSVAGVVTGLQGIGLQLRETVSAQTITVNQGIWAFSTQIDYGSSYNIIVLTQPSNLNQTCSVAGGSGTVSGTVTATVSCALNKYNLDVSVVGIGVGESATFQNGGENVTVNGSIAVNDSATFPTQIADNSTYNVSFFSSSPAMTCVITNPKGNIKGANATVNANCSTSTFTIAGGITQTGANINGTKVIVSLFGSATELLNPIQSITLNVGTDPLSTAFPYSLPGVPNGNYFIRVFRDHGSSIAPSNPDGFPTIGVDYQAGGPVTVAGSNIISQNYNLADTTTVTGTNVYQNYNAFHYHENYYSYAPKDAGNNDGQGLCSGFYLRLQAEAMGATANLSSPEVLFPDGVSRTLLDDGGCSSSVANNLSKGYDYGAGDKKYSRGIANPASSDLGDYTFYYSYTGTPPNLFYHVQPDNIASINKLPRNIPVTSPARNVHLSTLTPTFVWSAAAGANSYAISVSNRTGYQYSAFITSGTAHSISPGQSLVDDKSYRVTITAYDQIVGSQDIDAASFGVENYFLADTGANSFITVSGNIINKSGTSAGNALVYATGQNATDNWQANIQLSGGAASYSMEILKYASGTDARIKGVQDVNNYLTDYFPNMNTREYKNLSAAANIIRDIVFTVPPVITSPASLSTGNGTTPNFIWQAYATSVANAGGQLPAGAYTTIVYYNPNTGSGGIPKGTWALPAGASSFNLASLAGIQKYDITCLANGGTYSAGVCTGGTGASLTNLSTALTWKWGLVIAECDFNLYLNNTDANANTINDFQECIGPLLNSNDFFAETKETVFFAN